MKPIIRIFIILFLSVGLSLILIMTLQGDMPAVLAGGPWYVSPAGDNTTCLSWATACTTIQAAISKATSGDPIYISAGTYFAHLDNGGKALTLIGAGKGLTIIDGSGTGRVFFDSSSSTVITIQFQDLTIQNGNMATNNGGGIFANHNLILTNVDVLSSTTAYQGGGVFAWGDTTITGGHFENNWSTNNLVNECGGALAVMGILNISGTEWINNRAIRGGGAVYAKGNATIVNAQFENNRSTGFLGGAIYADAKLFMKDNQLISNQSYSGGGGIYVNGDVYATDVYYFDNHSLHSTAVGGGMKVDGSKASITNTVFISNTASYGSGLAIYGSTGANRVVNSLFARNKDTFGSAIDFIGNTGSSLAVLYTTIAGPSTGGLTASAIRVSTASAGITNTIITSYTTGIELGVSGIAYQDFNLFSNVAIPAEAGVGGGAHSRTGNPYFADPAHDNYHLSGGSKALDWAADIGIHTDFDGQPRPLGPGFDVGFDEALLIYLPLVLR